MTRRYALAFLVMSCTALIMACSGGDDSTPPAPSSPEDRAESTASGDSNPGATLVPITPAATATRTPAPSPKCPSTPGAGVSTRTTMADGVQRTYRLYVPNSYDASEPVPLLLNFHGLASDAREQELYSGFIQVAEREGIILVSPNGTGYMQSWHVIGEWEPNYVDDVAFVNQLIDEVREKVCIDETRIFAAGISNGGAMASLLGCNLDRIAAIATVAGAPYNKRDCERERNIPVIAFHGTEDYVVPFGLGEKLGEYLPITNVREDMQLWAESNGCNPDLLTTLVAPDVTLERYEDCDDDARVQLYVINGGGHTWPGADLDLFWLGRTTQSIKAAELIWSFFEENAK